MPNGFELVKKKRQRKCNKNIGLATAIYHESQDLFNKKLQRTVQEFESSQFYFELIETIGSCLTLISSNSINEILCYGIGNLDSKSSLHQLAALLKIQEKYNPCVTVYDPVFTLFEIKILEKLNFTVLVNNEEGKRKISNNLTTLVFFPHCPKQLTNNFLWANWNVSLSKCILIANSFSKIIQNSTSKTLKESADYLVKIYPKTTEIFLEQSYHIDNIFNDISIHCFKFQDLTENFFSETLGKEPVYSEESEIITKSRNLIVKND